MMIAHVSIPADDTKGVAGVLAEIMEGRATPFPPGGPNAFMAWAKNGEIEIEVTPRGAVMTPGPEEAVWEDREKAPAWESHLALCVDRPAAEVMEIAARAGWRARVCDRGGFFHVVEVWVENAYLIEVLDPDYAAAYRRTMTIENWTKTFGIAA